MPLKIKTPNILIGRFFLRRRRRGRRKRRRPNYILMLSGSVVKYNDLNWKQRDGKIFTPQRVSRQTRGAILI